MYVVKEVLNFKKFHIFSKCHCLALEFSFSSGNILLNIYTKAIILSWGNHELVSSSNKKNPLTLLAELVGTGPMRFHTCSLPSFDLDEVKIMMSSLMKIKIIEYEHCVSDYGLCILVFIETENFYLKMYS